MLWDVIRPLGGRRVADEQQRRKRSANVVSDVRITVGELGKRRAFAAGDGFEEFVGGLTELGCARLGRD
jgi:hypothetical protein